MFQQEKKYQAQGLLPNSGEKKKKETTLFKLGITLIAL